MPYIGNQPGTGVRSRFIYTATASQTTFSGADDNSKTLKYADSDYIDVFLNGVCLVPGTDYTASTKTSVVLTQAASLSDTLEVVAYDIATIADTVSKADGGTFNGDLGITNASPDITLTNNTTEDTDGGRESTVTFKGLQSGGEESTLAEIRASHDATADDQKGDLIFKTNDGSDGASPTEALRISSDAHVGIGENDPKADLVVKQSGSTFTPNANTVALFQRNTATGSGAMVSILSGNNSAADLNFADADDEDVGRIRYNHADNSMLFQTSAAERLRITSDGAMFFCTDFNAATAGVRLEVDGDSYFTAEGNNGRCIYANRLTSDGTIIEFAKAGTTCGYVGTGNSNDLYIGNEDTGFMFAGGSNAILPTNQTSLRDNAIDFGLSNYRYQDIYATNGTIQTSDEREKQNIASLTDAEMTAAKAISKLFKTFKWKDKVTEKGDNARTHAGVIAQQVETAMSDAGLDAGNYAFFISTTWWETQTEVAAVEANEEKRIEAKDAYTRTDTYHTKDEAPEGATERNRKGIRYPELLSFIGAATEQRLTSIESRLTALEAE